MDNNNIQTNTNYNELITNSDQLKTLRQISLLFFFAIGGIHILTGLFISHNILMPISNIINKILDIPFAVIAVIYGLSNMHIDSQSPKRKLYYGLMIALSLLVLGIMLYINLLVPDRI